MTLTVFTEITSIKEKNVFANGCCIFGYRQEQKHKEKTPGFPRAEDQGYRGSKQTSTISV